MTEFNTKDEIVDKEKGEVNYSIQKFALEKLNFYQLASFFNVS